MPGRLPSSSISYFPKRMRDENDAGIIALAAKLDSYLVAWEKELKLEAQWRNVARIPTQFLPEMAYYVGATLLNSDSDSTKRQKIANSIQNLQNLSLWQTSIKLTIDSITGASSSFYNNVNAADWIMFGGSETIPGQYLGIIGADGIDLGEGLDLVGAGTEIDIVGNVAIDCGTGGPMSAAQVSQIVLSIQSQVPCYLRVFLGYTSGGSFVTYSGGQIG